MPETGDRLPDPPLNIPSPVPEPEPEPEPTAARLLPRRLAHQVFRDLKSSALGIRLPDLPSALQTLFFGDSASLLSGTGGGGGAQGSGASNPPGRTPRDVHLIM